MAGFAPSTMRKPPRKSKPLGGPGSEAARGPIHAGLGVAPVEADPGRPCRAGPGDPVGGHAPRGHCLGDLRPGNLPGAHRLLRSLLGPDVRPGVSGVGRSLVPAHPVRAGEGRAAVAKVRKPKLTDKQLHRLLDQATREWAPVGASKLREVVITAVTVGAVEAAVAHELVHELCRADQGHRAIHALLAASRATLAGRIDPRTIPRAGVGTTLYGQRGARGPCAGEGGTRWKH